MSANRYKGGHRYPAKKWWVTKVWYWSGLSGIVDARTQSLPRLCTLGLRTKTRICNRAELIA